MKATLDKVEVTQRKVMGYRFNFEQNTAIDVRVTASDREILLHIDSRGIDMVTDGPGSLVGAMIDWQDAIALSERNAEIKTKESSQYVVQLEQENAELRAELGRMDTDRFELASEEASEYAKPF